MRSTVGLCLVLGACGFSGNGSSGAPPDAPGADAAPDAPPDAALPVVRVQATGAAVQGTILGGTVGTQRSGLTCPAGELPIGASFDVTTNPLAAYNNQRVVTGVRLRCGRVELVAGAFRVTATSQAIVMGASTGCPEFMPAITSSEVRCPDGSVLVGLGGNRPGVVLFNNVALRCAPLVAGVPSLPVASIAVPGTGTDSNSPQAAQCPAQTALVTLKPYVSCGVDAVIASCSALALVAQ